jgi:uncharacterized protein
VTNTTVELALNVMAVLNERDPDRLIELSDPDVEWHSFFSLGVTGGYRGHDGIRRYMNELGDAFEVVGAEIDDGIGVDDTAVVVGSIHYRGKGSGVENSEPAGWMLKFREGKVLAFRPFRDPAAALETVGLQA